MKDGTDGTDEVGKRVTLAEQPRGDAVPPATVDAIVRAIAERLSPDQIVIFGSYASGRPVPDSDLDLPVVMETELPRHKRAATVRLLFRPLPAPWTI
ncbi:MAG: nucleotidyltransferase domain-containing protein [Deltaproteobacteria bacterium]|nr:nucleotidyltransferase domain-containing protein [Deltaproteobacteria bacterium]